MNFHLTIETDDMTRDDLKMEYEPSCHLHFHPQKGEGKVCETLIISSLFLMNLTVVLLREGTFLLSLTDNLS